MLQARRMPVSTLWNLWLWSCQDKLEQDRNFCIQASQACTHKIRLILASPKSTLAIPWWYGTQCSRQDKCKSTRYEICGFEAARDMLEFIGNWVITFIRTWVQTNSGHPEESWNTSMDHTKLQNIQSDKPAADQRINERHDNLSSATTKVAPTCSNTICSAYNFAAKHGAHPELTRHERRQGEADEESNDDETRHCWHWGHRVNSWRNDHDEESTSVSGSHKITNSAHYKTGKNWACHQNTHVLHSSVISLGISFHQILNP